jgi:hypothetical protein
MLLGRIAAAATLEDLTYDDCEVSLAYFFGCFGTDGFFSNCYVDLEIANGL